MTELYHGRITDLLNNSMRYHPETISIGYAILQEKQRLLDLALRTRLMAMIDTADEALLDYLAVELRTPAYRDTLPPEAKRRLIAGTLPFYERLGTPSAVNWLICSLFGAGEMEEWFQYGGEAHHFRVHVLREHAVVSIEDFHELIRAVSLVKRLSSWLDDVIFTVSMPPSFLHMGGGFGIQSGLGVPQEPDVYEGSAAVPLGEAGGLQSVLGITEDASIPRHTGALHTGGGFSGQASIPVPPDDGPPSSTTILRTGGVYTILSNRFREE